MPTKVIFTEFFCECEKGYRKVPTIILNQFNVTEYKFSNFKCSRCVNKVCFCYSLIIKVCYV